MHQYTDQQWITWFDQLSQQDYVVVDNFISDELYRNILLFFQDLIEQNELSRAGIGTAGQHQIKSSIRGDMIYWLDQNRDRELKDFFNLADDLVKNLKRHCFLSISDYEFHLAFYPPGTRYEKHIDQFHGRTNRMISMLIYLNEHWSPDDGGELKIFRPGSEILIEPIAKRLVLFRSDSVEHEVLTTNSGRMSLTGWLLHQPSSLGYFMS